MEETLVYIGKNSVVAPANSAKLLVAAMSKL
jgi:hypothetical protein